VKLAEKAKKVGNNSERVELLTLDLISSTLSELLKVLFYQSSDFIGGYSWLKPFRFSYSFRLMGNGQSSKLATSLNQFYLPNNIGQKHLLSSLQSSQHYDLQSDDAQSCEPIHHF
jgi:hypothetical protein